jgi:hypothetical protein
VFQRQSRTWADQSDISGWNSQSHARMHERLTAAQMIVSSLLLRSAPPSFA